MTGIRTDRRSVVACVAGLLVLSALAGTAAAGGPGADGPTPASVDGTRDQSTTDSGETTGTASGPISVVVPVVVVVVLVALALFVRHRRGGSGE